MKITLTGSLGNISKPMAANLIANGHQVTVISSDADRKAEIEALGAAALIGSVEDTAFLTEAFKGADVVYTMVPPSYGNENYRTYIGRIGQHYADAILASGVKQVVNLSSVGAHLTEGTGPIKGLHDVEQILNKLKGVIVKHLRPVYFFINLYGNIDMIKHLDLIGANYSADTRKVMVHPDDIAIAAAEEIEGSFTQPVIRYIAGDEFNASEIASVLGAAIGKPELNWVEFTDQQALEGMIQGGLSEEIAKNYVEMGNAISSGKLWENYELHKPAVMGKIKLEQFAVLFAGKY